MRQFVHSAFGVLDFTSLYTKIVSHCVKYIQFLQAFKVRVVIVRGLVQYWQIFSSFLIPKKLKKIFPMLQSAPCDNNYVSIFSYNIVIIFMVLFSISKLQKLYNWGFAKSRRLFWCFTLLCCLSLMLPSKLGKVDIFHRLIKPTSLL